MKILLSKKHLRFTGSGGSLRVPDDDEVCRRLALLIEGECEDLGAAKAAEKYDFTRQRSVERIIADYGLQKKLYTLNPAPPPQFVQTQRTGSKQRPAPADPKSLERQIRQGLADKICGNQVGIWLLSVPNTNRPQWPRLFSCSTVTPANRSASLSVPGPSRWLRPRPRS